MLIGLLWYITICVIAYCVMSDLYKDEKVVALKAPKQRWVYYLLQFTWGLPMNIAGLVVAFVMFCFRRLPYQYGWGYCYELPVNFGLELGIFFIAPIGGSEHLKEHEFGHGIQNIYFGPFTIGMVSIPSVTRYWLRELKKHLGKELTTAYDDIWFEGQASKSGHEFMAQQR